MHKATKGDKQSAAPLYALWSPWGTSRLFARFLDHGQNGSFANARERFAKAKDFIASGENL